MLACTTRGHGSNTTAVAAVRSARSGRGHRHAAFAPRWATCLSLTPSSTTIPSRLGRRGLFGWSGGKIQDTSYEVIEGGVSGEDTDHSTEPQRVMEGFPDEIELPSYALSSIPPQLTSIIPIHSEEEIASARVACAFAKHLLDFSTGLVEAGITTAELDRLTREEAVRGGGYPSPLNYMRFPKSICTSVNNVVCHGIPDDRPLQPTDVINVDISVFIGGFHGDTSRTVALDAVDDGGRSLLEAGQRALEAGIAVCRPGLKFAAIGAAIHASVEASGYTVCKEFVGHGIGRDFHSLPHILHYENWNPGFMEPGMIFTIEPAVNEFGPQMNVLDDGWTAVTTDGGRSCQYEHTILVTEDGIDQLT